MILKYWNLWQCCRVAGQYLDYKISWKSYTINSAPGIRPFDLQKHWLQWLKQHQGCHGDGFVLLGNWRKAATQYQHRLGGLSREKVCSHKAGGSTVCWYHKMIVVTTYLKKLSRHSFILLASSYLFHFRFGEEDNYGPGLKNVNCKGKVIRERI